MGCAFGAEQKKSRNAALFLCAETLIAVWKYGGGRLPHNLHPNPQPSAKRDILPGITNCWDADPSGFAQRAHNSVGAIHESPAAPR